MSDVKISKINEIYMYVDADRGILREIYERFSFRIPNAQFNPKVKDKIWDGFIRELSLKSQTMKVGLLPRLHKFLSKNGYSIELDPTLIVGTEFSNEDFDALCKTLEVQLTPWEHQRKAVVHSINEGRVTLLSPTSSGKSFIISLFMNHHRAHGRKTLIICPRVNLVNQMADDIASYSEYVPNLKLIGDGADKNVKEDDSVVISTWQSVFRMPQKWFEQFDVLIGDEVHEFEAASLKGITEKTVNAKYRMGASGTIRDAKTHVYTIEGAFGPVYTVATTKELMDLGIVARLKIQPIIFMHKKENIPPLSKLNYDSEFALIKDHETRNNTIVDIALTLQSNTLILVDHIESHGQLIYDIAKQKTNRPVYFIHGKSDKDDKKNIRKIMEENDGVVCVAGAAIFSTGVSINNLHNVFYATLGRSKVRILQSIGRSLRLHDEKDFAYFFDFADDLRDGRKKQNYALKHFLERMEYYNREQFEILQPRIINV